MSFISPELGSIVHLNTPSGPPYESAMVEAMTIYCRDQKIACHKTIGSLLDSHHGTDFLIGKDVGKNRLGLGFIRMDFTHNFKNKDNMPLMWDVPIDDKNLVIGPEKNGTLQFGIRTANTASGFEEPVIVIGIQSDTESINLQLSEIRKSLRQPEKLDAILTQAVHAMAAYRYQTEPAYQKYIDEYHEKGYYQNIPDMSCLYPNYDGLENLHTRKRTPETVKSIRLAQKLAEEALEDMAEFDNPETKDSIKTFSHKCYGLLKGNLPKIPEPESWNKKVENEYARLQEIWAQDAKQQDTPKYP